MSFIQASKSDFVAITSWGVASKTLTQCPSSVPPLRTTVAQPRTPGRPMSCMLRPPDVNQAWRHRQPLRVGSVSTVCPPPHTLPSVRLLETVNASGLNARSITSLQTGKIESVRLKYPDPFGAVI